MIRARFTGLDAALDELRAQLDQDGVRAFDAVAQLVADEAATSHPYTNRTGELQAHTVPGVTHGRISDNTLRTEVLGDTPYGEYVEDGHDGRFSFLQPAYERRENDAAALVEREINSDG